MTSLTGFERAVAVSEALRVLSSVEPEPDLAPEDAPVLLLAAAWRTGSTWLQRMFVASGVMMWGEPHGPVELLPAIVDGLIDLCVLRHPAPTRWLLDKTSGDELATKFIANIYPRPAAYRRALREFFRQWLGVSAEALGFQRWGLKEVRWGAAEAVVMRWLFPASRIVFLARDPVEAWRSQREIRFLDPATRSALTFARHWANNVDSWRAMDPGTSEIVRYEDLIGPSSDAHLARLAAWTNVPVLGSVGVVGAVEQKATVDDRDLTAIDMVCRAPAAAIGYPVGPHPNR